MSFFSYYENFFPIFSLIKKQQRPARFRFLKKTWFSCMSWRKLFFSISPQEKWVRFIFSFSTLFLSPCETVNFYLKQVQELPHQCFVLSSIEASLSIFLEPLFHDVYYYTQLDLFLVWEIEKKKKFDTL